MAGLGRDATALVIPGSRKSAPRNDGVSVRTSYPRPTNGILVAITVMNSTLASSGRLAM
jgi:hypothetical protein